MFIFRLIGFFFLLAFITLLIVLFIVKHTLWKINRKFSKSSSSPKKTNSKNTQNTIKPDEGEYVDFEEVKE